MDLAGCSCPLISDRHGTTSATHAKLTRVHLLENGALEPDLIDRRIYPSFGECIYCGAKAADVKLTDEHVVPFALGGNAVITDGSCQPCAVETSKVERELCKAVLGDFRNSVGEQTRRPKDRPTTGSFVASINHGPRQIFTVPIADVPLFTAMPVWGLPGLITGAPPTDQFQEEKAHVFWHVPPTMRDTLALNPWDVAELPYPEFRIDNHKVARAIAKIGFCEAVLFWGLHGFRRLVLPDLIMGRYPLVPHFVGTPLMNPDPPLEAKAKHSVKLSVIRPRGMRLLLAQIRLYGNSGVADHGMPEYYVVVGAPRGTG